METSEASQAQFQIRKPEGTGISTTTVESQQAKPPTNAERAGEHPEPIPPDEARDVYTRMTDKKTSQIRFGENQQLSFALGVDPQKSWNELGLAAFIDPTIPSTFELIDHTGMKIDPSTWKSPIPTRNIQYIQDSQGKRYNVNADAWVNVTIYPDQEGSEGSIEPRFKKGAQDAHRVWEAALQGEAAVRATISQVRGEDGEEVAKTIADIVTMIEQFPELQENSAWGRDFDIQSFATRAGTIAEAKRIFEDTTHKERLPFQLRGTNLEQRVNEIIAKIINRQPLTPDDRTLSQAIQFAETATAPSMHKLGHLVIDEFTRPYAMANLAEVAIGREVVGPEIYDLHRDQYVAFAEAMNEAGGSGFTMPEWFSAYKGSEFRWGFAIHRDNRRNTIANAGGQFFLSSEQTPESITLTLDHERIHTLRKHVEDQGVDKRRTAARAAGSSYRYRGMDEHHQPSEAYTEAFSLVVASKGKIEDAIKTNAQTNVAYKTGSQELLVLLQEIEQASGTKMLGARLMTEGLQQVAEATSEHQLDAVRNYYDKNIAGREGAFDERMGRFADSEMDVIVYPSDETDTETPEPSMPDRAITTATQAVQALTYEDLVPEAMRLTISPDRFAQNKQWLCDRFANYPDSIWGFISLPEYTPMLKAARQAVLADPDAKQQMKDHLEEFYREYAQQLGEIGKN